MERLLIVDLLAERQAFGEKGCEEIMESFSQDMKSIYGLLMSRTHEIIRLESG